MQVTFTVLTSSFLLVDISFKYLFQSLKLSLGAFLKVKYVTLILILLFFKIFSLFLNMLLLKTLIVIEYLLTWKPF